MYARYIKRPIDLVMSFVMLTLLALPMAIIALLIRLESNGPALFKQARTGKDGQEFTLLKFRSMTAHNNVYDHGTHNELTRVGALIRKTSLDELPQLINVIKGEMSFIGPRPWIPEYHKHMNTKQRHRYDVRPGITGSAQVYGRNNLSIGQKINYDLLYVNNIGLLEDIKVALLTVTAVITKEGHEMGKSGIHTELDTLRKLYLNHQLYENNSRSTANKIRS